MIKALAAKIAPAIAKPLILATLAAPCPLPENTPQVNVYFTASKPLYVPGVPMKTLTQALTGKLNSTFVSDSQWGIQGATVGSKIQHSTFNVRFYPPLTNGTDYCLYINDINVVLEDDVTIYLAEEINKSKCVKTVVTKHEERHVKVDYDTIREYVPKLKMALLRYVAGLGTLGPYNRQQTIEMAKTIHKEVGGVVAPVFVDMLKTISKRQAALDTPENYHREQALCPGAFGPPGKDDNATP
ncbi:MAG: hypothetical protein GC185_03425 [Alphaproteobacteria bacterium]|nr:hypothetical protein [Alphaproteobacteria bacterium]